MGQGPRIKTFATEEEAKAYWDGQEDCLAWVLARIDMNLLSDDRAEKKVFIGKVTEQFRAIGKMRDRAVAMAKEWVKNAIN